MSLRSFNTAGLVDNTAVSAANIWDLPDGVEANLTPRQALRLAVAVMAGKLSGAPSGPIVIRDLADTKDRVTATVDGAGNRTGVTTDVT